MIGFLVWTFRAAAAVVVLPVAARAILAGQWIGAGLMLAVLLILCSVADTDQR